MDGITIDSMSTLQEQLQYYRVGEEVTLTVMIPVAGGEYEEQQVEVELGKAARY